MFRSPARDSYTQFNGRSNAVGSSEKEVNSHVYFPPPTLVRAYIHILYGLIFGGEVGLVHGCSLVWQLFTTSKYKMNSALSLFGYYCDRGSIVMTACVLFSGSYMASPQGKSQIATQQWHKLKLLKESTQTGMFLVASSYSGTMKREQVYQTMGSN